MDIEEEILEPVSPTAQCFNSSVMSVSVLAVLECEIPIDDSKTMSLINDVLLPLNPLFSSIMIKEITGDRKWKKVKVNPEDHVFVPTFPSNLSTESYDEYFNEYMTKLAQQQLPQSKPLWEIHIFKYPTKNSAGNVIFKLHHSLGDGYSLMGVLLSCLKRADDPSLSLTFPSRQRSEKQDEEYGGAVKSNVISRLCEYLLWSFNSVLDFGRSIIKSNIVEDDLTPIRSGGEGVEFRPFSIWTMKFSLHHIKQIKSKLRVTINDVLTGMIFLGLRMYMQETSPNSIKSNSTALVMLSTRMFGSYMSVQDMLKPNSESPWGNRIAFLHVEIPKVSESLLSNPLEFIKVAQKLVMKKRNSYAVFLVAKFLQMVNKLRGHEEAARYIYKTLKNSSTTISNLIGPMEKMALDNQPAKGMYFMMAGGPQSLTITVVSYMGDLRIAFGSEKEFIDQQKLKACMENAFQKIFRASLDVSIYT